MKDSLIKLKTIADPRGSLVVLEEGKDVPFPIRRSYFIYGTKKNEPRGFHAHKTLHQVFVCLQGSCEIRLDDGKDKSTLKMDTPSFAVYVGPMVWHEMHDFSPDCIFLSYASDFYKESDYIRDYDSFLRQVSGG